MKFNDLVDLLFSMWLAGSKQTVMLLGPPGGGKTAVGRTLAKRITQHLREIDSEAEEACCHVKDLSSSLPEDLNGLPKTDGDQMRFVPDGWLYDVCQPGRQGVLVLDDLPAASTSVQVAARQISLDRRAHEHRIADGVFILITGNRREDKSAARTLPAHFRNSVLMLELEPTLDEWAAWYGTQGLDNLVPSYLLWRRTHFSQLPKDADRRGVFATPRTWHMLGRLIATARKKDAVQPVAMGLVGEGIAAELLGFEAMRQAMVAPEEVLQNPERALPEGHDIWKRDRVDVKIATLSGVCDLAAKSDKPRVLEALVKAMAFICKDDAEYVAVALTVFTASGGSSKALAHKAIKLRSREPLVDRLLKQMHAALM